MCFGGGGGREPEKTSPVVNEEQKSKYQNYLEVTF